MLPLRFAKSVVSGRLLSTAKSTSALPAWTTWNYPTPIRFGAGRIQELGDACKELNMKRPLIVTDPALAALPMIAGAQEICERADLRCFLFSDVQGNPVEENVTAGVDFFREKGCDGVIAFGGGSALDAAKAIALMVGQDRPLWDFEDREDWYTRVNVQGMAPVVAVPTTSGTGSEVGRSSVITDTRDHTKKIIFHPNMLPARVILDPELTCGLPAHLTAAVGMDALSHSMEAFCSPVYHPMAQGIALEGMRLVKEYLKPAVEDGNDVTARAHLQVASMMGATAFQKGLGAMHSLSHPCGAVLGTHHGLNNAVCMPYVLNFNREKIEDDCADLASFLGLEQSSWNGVMDWVLEMRSDIDIPHTLDALGVTGDHIPQLAPMAAVDPTAGTNPVNLTESNCASLYQDCIEGRGL
eukprot:g3605.t1